MKRIREENRNSPEAFDRVWREEMAAGRRQFDLYRFRAMKDELVERKPQRIIELAAGCSEFLTFALNHLAAAGQPHVKAYGLDYSPWAMEYMAQVDPRIHWTVGNALHSGMSAGAFDAVLCGELIEHLEEPAALVAEMARICRPGGLFRITTLVPELQHTDPYHVWSFEPEDLLRLFRAHAPAELRQVGNYLVVTGYPA